MKNFLKWLAFSSENPKEVALTIQGIIVLSIPTIVGMLNEAGINVLEGQVVETVVIAISLFGAGLAIIGLIRKLANTFGAKEIVMFKAKKKGKKA